jgi:hypothetical protein
VEAARELAWGGPGRPGPWRRVTRRFRDGHAETWWAADAVLGGWGPDRRHRLVVATADPATLPKGSTWYLLTNLARPAGRRAQQAQLSEIVGAYGLRNWVEQGYKQVKDELGWADFQVRSDTAIRRHWILVCCAFSFCWHHWFTPPPDASAPPPTGATAQGGERGLTVRRRTGTTAVLAPRHPTGPQLADPLDTAATLVARMVHGAPAP